MRIIELKITLEYIEPAVTRTLQVPSSIRLDRLHLTIQAAMGWTNSHLYMFEAGGATWGLPDPDFGGDDLPANKTTLAELIEASDLSPIPECVHLITLFRQQFRFLAAPNHQVRFICKSTLLGNFAYVKLLIQTILGYFEGVLAF